MIKKCTIFAFLLINTATLYAKANDSDTARTMLMNALVQSTSASFVFQTRNPDIIFYRTHSATGKLLQRYERYDNGRLVEMAIMNEDGMFQIGKDYVVHFKMDDSIILKMFGPLWNTFPTIRKVDERVNCDYKMRTVHRKSIPCYKITMTAPYDDGSLANFYKMSLENVQKYRAKIIAKYPHIMEFTVGRDNGFIYALNVYAHTGEKISGLDIGDVRIVSAFEPALFEIPKDKKVETAKNFDAVMKINTKHTSPQEPSIFQSIASFFSRNLENILDWGGRIAFWLSIILVSVIVVFKIRQKRRTV